MNAAWALIIVGAILAAFVHFGLGVALIIIGVLLLLLPELNF